MKCKLSEKCEFGNLCKDATRHDSLTVLGCSSFKTKKPMTNDEWRRTCSTEEFAEWLHDITGYEGICSVCDDCTVSKHEKCRYSDEIDGWIKWLKEIHHEMQKV